MMDKNVGQANDKQWYRVYKYVSLIECIRRIQQKIINSGNGK